MRVFLSVFVLFLLASCTAKGPLYTEKANLQSPETGKSLVYVYRVDTFIASSVAATLLDDGREVGVINVGGYISYLANPGTHKLHTDTSRIDAPLYLEMEAGKTYYLRIDYDAGIWTGTFIISPRPEAEALPQLKLTRYQGS